MKQRDVSVWQEERAKEFCEEWYKTQVKKDHKIVVIDDDPTGTQTVHDVPVYTAYDLEHIRKGFKEETPLFYVLANSRSLKQKETEKLHLQLGRDIAQAAKESGKTCTVISRGDSTLRGHYPLETQCLKQAMEEISGEKIDGEIIAPFFLEGGRITAGDIHYVVQKDGEMVPAGETEFAKDKTFSYHASDLKKWIEEKTAGKVKEEDVLSFSLEDLRNGTPEKIADRLEDVCDFGKVIVNAVCYEDMIAFARGYELALERGKRFIFRSAAAVPKVLGRITDQPLLTRRDMIREKTKAGGLIVAGSHVKKTTDQLKCLLEDKNRVAVEFNQHLILDHEKMENEFSRVMGLVNQSIKEGRTTVVYTRRERLDLNTGNAEDELKVATDISRYLTRIVEELKVKPAFIVAKGGITSSDIGVKGLKISRGWVLGQIRPGIPVWEADENSRFPGIPYVVFPGNVGNEEDLKKVAEIMEAKKKPIVAVLLGDGSGVGPELVVKLADKGVLASCGKPLILGNVKLWEKAVAEFAPGLKWQQVEKAEEADWFKGIPVLSVGEQEPDRFTIGQVNEICGKSCIEMIQCAVELYKKGLVKGVCYAPLNKGAMKLAHNPVASETELFAFLLGQKKGYGEINMLDNVWTTRVTSHIPVSEISNNLTEEGILESIELAYRTLKQAGYETPEIGVAALNPHGGEGGLCGKEEITVIGPAVKAAEKMGIHAKGPFPADTLFKQAFDGRFNAVVTMYHDQGQIALKLKGFERGITIGGGLRLPATTCAHGTAHDIAWKGIASTQSLENAYRMVCRMAENV